MTFYPRILGARYQRQCRLDHPKPLCCVEVVAGPVQSLQVAEAQLLNRFPATPGDLNERLGAAPSRRRIHAMRRDVDQSEEVVVEGLHDLPNRNIDTGRWLLQRCDHGNLLCTSDAIKRAHGDA
jgi:hypothetical protein